MFPDGINALGQKEKKRVLSTCGGEKCGFQKVSAVKQFHFPEVEGCKFIPEGVLWRRIDEKYDEFYVNDLFRIYYQFEGISLSNREKSAARYQSDYLMYKYLLNDKYVRPKYLSRSYLITLYMLQLCADCSHIRRKDMLFGMKAIDQLSITLFYIPIQYIRKRR